MNKRNFCKLFLGSLITLIIMPSKPKYIYVPLGDFKDIRLDINEIKNRKFDLIEEKTNHSFTQKEKEEFISKILMTSKGHKKLAKEMKNPFRNRLIGRLG